MSVSLDSNENTNMIMADDSNDGAEKQLTVPSSDRNEEPKPTISKGQLILTFIVGITTDISASYFGSATFQGYIALPCFNPAPGILIGSIAPLLGSLFVPFLMSKFSPEVSVIFCASLQFLAGLFFWWLPSPFNYYFGDIVYRFSLGALVSVYPSLFTRLEPMVIRCYMGGVTLSLLFGQVVVIIFDAIGVGRTTHMITLCIFPVVNVSAFYFLDRSQFRQTKNGDNHHNGDEEKVVSNVLSPTEMLSASKEMAYRYYLWYFSFVLCVKFFFNMDFPYIGSSVFSYAGFDTKMEIFLELDKLNIYTSSVIAVVGISVMTPLGRIIPSNINIYFMWVPTLSCVFMAITLMVGLLAGAFPPLPPGWYISFKVMLSLCATLIGAYTIVYIAFDKTMTAKYHEFQVQSLYMLSNAIGFIFSLFSLFWFSAHVRMACDTNYQDVYTTENVTCSFYDNTVDGFDC